MKTLLIIPALLVLLSSCDDEKFVQLEATMGVPFVVTAPAEVTIKETGKTVYISKFINYTTGGIVMSNTYAIVIYADKSYEVSNSPHCDFCTGGKVLLEANLELVYQKIIKETCVRNCDNRRREIRVDRAQFVLKSVN